MEIARSKGFDLLQQDLGQGCENGRRQCVHLARSSGNCCLSYGFLLGSLNFGKKDQGGYGEMRGITCSLHLQPRVMPGNPEG